MITPKLRRFLLPVILGMLLITLLWSQDNAQRANAAVNITGVWNLIFEGNVGAPCETATITQTGTDLSGTLCGDPTATGSIDQSTGEFTFELIVDPTCRFALLGAATANSMSGTWIRGIICVPLESDTFTGSIKVGVDAWLYQSTFCHTAGGISSTCPIPASSTFTVDVVLGSFALADKDGDTTAGYIAFQGNLSYSAGLTLKNQPGTSEIIWPDCDPVSATDSKPAGGYQAICATSLGTESMYTGTVLTIEFNCSLDNQETIALDHGGVATHLLDDISQPVFEGGPDVLTINCGAPPKLPFPGDSDGDGCADTSENRPKSEVVNGGGRDWLNPWDFYDVNGDGVIDLFGDILGVIQHYSLDGSPPYDVIYDRGPTAGPNPWNMTAPDGEISLFVDILAVIRQYTLTGCT